MLFFHGKMVKHPILNSSLPHTDLIKHMSKVFRQIFTPLWRGSEDPVEPNRSSRVCEIRPDIGGANIQDVGGIFKKRLMIRWMTSRVDQKRMLAPKNGILEEIYNIVFCNATGFFSWHTYCKNATWTYETPSTISWLGGNEYINSDPLLFQAVEGPCLLKLS